MQKIYVNQTNIYAFKDMIKNINEDENNIIIVPDKFSLNSEQLFFEENNLSVSFSTQTFSLTKLASKVLEKILIDKKIIDKNVSIMIISSIINDNLNNFKHFKNIKDINEFSSDVYDFISQVLSSSVVDFNENLPKNLQDKFDDINFIIKEYKNCQKKLLVDASFKFDLFLNEIKNSEIIKKSNFYFGMFNSLTTQGKNIIKEICKYAKSVSFACAKTQSRVNNNEIFEFYHSIDKHCEVIQNNSLNGYNDFIINNFFTTNKNKFDLKNNEIKLFEAKNIDDEISNTIYEIRKDIFLNGYRFKDIAICLGEFKDYSEKLKKKFSDLNFSCFVDESVKLNNFAYTRFLIGFLKCLNNFSIISVLDLLKSGFIEIDKEILKNFENFLLKYNLKTYLKKENYCFFEQDELFESYVFVMENFVSKILDFKNNLQNKSVREFFNDFEALLETFGVNKRLNEKIEAEKLNDILKYKQLVQIDGKVKKCYENICDYCEKFDLSKIIYFLSVCFENTFVNLVPVGVDAIFVGDSINSYFKTYKKLYVLGLDANFPKLTKDNSLFLEGEIKLLEKDCEINPKPSLVNKITYFKCFENLLCSEKELCLSYSVNKNNTQNFPSIFLKNFLKLFNVLGEPIKLIKVNIDAMNLLDYNKILGLLAFKFDKKEDFIKNYYLSENGNLKNVLKQVVLDKTNWQFEKIYENIDKNLIEKQKYSASALENYFACSKKFFYKNILGLLPSEKVDFDAKCIGNIVHACAKKFADNFVTYGDVDKKIQEKIVDEVLNCKDYIFLEKLLNEKNKLENLKSEILKLFDFILNQQKSSAYKITKSEFGFSEKFDNFEIKGYVDRIDENENGFLVVDYKTGRTKIDFSDIVLGKKVQLLLYAKMLEKKLKKPCYGVYYLTVNDDFSQKQKNKIYLNGLTVNENNNLASLGDEKNFEFKEKYLLTKKQFDKLKDFVFEKILDAIKNINLANFKENPIKTNDFYECDYCEFSSICAEKQNNVFEFDENMIKEILND